MSVKADQRYEAVITTIPNGGWGWIIVIASFLANFVADGVIYTFGLYLQEIAATFDRPIAEVALANSFMTGTYFLAAPIGSALTNRYGFRGTAFLGGVIATFAIFYSSITYNFWIFVIIFGFGGGLGFCLLYIPSIVVIGYYFDKWRALATSVAVCGSAAGIIGFPPLYGELMRMLHWRKKFQICACMCLAVAITSLAYKPLTAIRIVKESPVIEPTPTPSLRQRKRHVCWCSKCCFEYNNRNYPTAAKLGYNPFNLEKRAKSVTFHTLADDTSFCGRLNSCYKWITCQPERDIPNRPMYREDIFYSSSLLTLTHDKNTAGPSAMKQALIQHTRAEAVEDSEDEADNLCGPCCTHPCLRAMGTMCDCSLLYSPTMGIFCFASFVICLGLFTPFIYFIDRAEVNNISPTKARIFMSCLGVANLFGRLSCGIIASIPKISALLITAVYILIAGLSTVISTFSYHPEAQLIYAIFYGFTTATFGSLRSIVIVELFGLKELTNAFGIIMTFEGVASFIGPPIAGWLYDLRKNYDYSFYFAGGVEILGFFLYLLMKVVNMRERRKI